MPLLPDHSARSIAQKTLTDLGIIRTALDRNTGTLDRGTLAVTYGPQAVVYEGCCALVVDATSRVVDAAGGQAVLSESVVHLPRGTQGIHVGQIFELLDAPHSPQLVGVEFEIVRADSSTHSLLRKVTVRRLQTMPAPASPAPVVP